MGLLARIGKLFTRAPKQEVMTRRGVSGTNAVGGFLVSNERSADLAGSAQRFKTLNDMMLNTAVVGACTRYYLSMVSGVGWTVSPPEDGGAEAEYYAEIIEKIIHDMDVPWYRVVRGAALFKLLGFSVQEWTAKCREDGVIGFATIERRPQFTIEQWDLDDAGCVHGFGQRVPYDGRLLYIPREKCIYVVDDSITDAPDGVGLLRHSVETNRTLRRLEQLEGWGYECDARGIPVGKAPLAHLADLVNKGFISQAEADARVNGIKKIVQNHVKNPGLGLIRDSATYTDQSPALTPSGTEMYGLELLRGDGAGLAEICEAIKRKNLEIARTMGLEFLLMGGDGKGSLALSHDKTDAFAQLLQSSLMELSWTFRTDVVDTIFELNGWPKEMRPELLPDAVQLSSITEIVEAVSKMSAAGSYMPPDDPIWNQIRDMLHLAEQPKVAPNVQGILGAQPAMPPAPRPTFRHPDTPIAEDPVVDEQDEQDIQDEQDEQDVTDTAKSRIEVRKIIGELGSKFILYSHDGKVLGTHPTREAAEAQERAIESAKHAEKRRKGKRT